MFHSRRVSKNKKKIDSRRKADGSSGDDDNVRKCNDMNDGADEKQHCVDLIDGSDNSEVNFQIHRPSKKRGPGVKLGSSSRRTSRHEIKLKVALDEYESSNEEEQVSAPLVNDSSPSVSFQVDGSLDLEDAAIGIDMGTLTVADFQGAEDPEMLDVESIYPGTAGGDVRGAGVSADVVRMAKEMRQARRGTGKDIGGVMREEETETGENVYNRLQREIQKKNLATGDLEESEEALDDFERMQLEKAYRLTGGMQNRSFVDAMQSFGSGFVPRTEDPQIGTSSLMFTTIPSLDKAREVVGKEVERQRDVLLRAREEQQVGIRVEDIICNSYMRFCFQRASSSLQEALSEEESLRSQLRKLQGESDVLAEFCCYVMGLSGFLEERGALIERAIRVRQAMVERWMQARREGRMEEEDTLKSDVLRFSEAAGRQVWGEVHSQFSSLEVVCKRFAEVEAWCPSRYRQAYLGVSLEEALVPYVKMELLSLDLFGLLSTSESEWLDSPCMAWLSTLKGYTQLGEDIAANLCFAALLPLVSWEVENVWDPEDEEMTRSLIRICETCAEETGDETQLIGAVSTRVRSCLPEKGESSTAQRLLSSLSSIVPWLDEETHAIVCQRIGGISDSAMLEE